MTLTELVSRYGAFAVGGFITLEGMGLPVPGEIILVTAAALAAQGELSITEVAIGAWMGTIAGGTGGYWIGRTGGLAMIRKVGRWAGLNDKREAKARSFFERHGAKTIIIARFIAVLRMIAGILAGAAEMSFVLFTICNALGGLLWSVTFTALGYEFGRNLPLLEHYLRRWSLVVLAAAVLAIGIWALRRRRRAA